MGDFALQNALKWINNSHRIPQRKRVQSIKDIGADRVSIPNGAFALATVLTAQLIDLLREEEVDLGDVGGAVNRLGATITVMIEEALPPLVDPEGLAELAKEMSKARHRQGDIHAIDIAQARREANGPENTRDPGS